jgi:hypothetical protein
MKCKQAFLLVNLRPHMLQVKASQHFVVPMGIVTPVFVVAFFVLFIIFASLYIAGIRFIFIERKLKREILEVSPQTHQNIWGLKASFDHYQRLKSFLESKELDEYPKVSDKKVVCYKAMKAVTSLLTPFALLFFAMGLMIIVLAIIQSF